MRRTLLITGATGKQGGAVIEKLLQTGADFTILAVTREPSAPRAQKLNRQSPRIILTQGDLDDIKALFENARNTVSGPIWGVYSVQNPMGSGQTVEKEIQQGKSLIDEALKHGVQHFVYSSVDRGGDKSFHNPTPVPHFASKHAVEHYLVEKAQGSDMKWTILRPVGFMDNYTPGFQAKVFFTAWKIAIRKDRPQQVVAVSDIGFFAAQAFIFPEKYQNRGISLAGDSLSFEDVERVFLEKTGRKIPTTYGFLASLILWSAKDIDLMFKWMNEEGFAADIPKLREEHLELVDFGTYIQNQSGFTAN